MKTEDIQQLFEKIAFPLFSCCAVTHLGLPLQQEGHGTHWQTLEAVLEMEGSGKIEIGLKDKTNLKGKPSPVRKMGRNEPLKSTRRSSLLDHLAEHSSAPALQFLMVVRGPRGPTISRA